MSTPFTVEQFLDVFRRYNEAVWPMQIGLFALGIVAVFLALRGARGRGQWTTEILGSLWLWMGVMYHWRFFADINPAAIVFGMLFVIQALLLFAISWGGQSMQFRPRADVFGITGAAFLFYALIGYPALGTVLGHRYPATPTFGLPCPTTIFTFGILLWAEREVPLHLVAIPALWSLLGFAAASSLGMAEDFGLLVAGVVGSALLLLRRYTFESRLSRRETGRPRSVMFQRRAS